MKKIAMLVAATAMFASVMAATALAAPAIPIGATPPPGMGGVCTDCHTYITPAKTPAPVVTVPTNFVRVWGSPRAVNAFAFRAKGSFLKVVFAGRTTRRAVFAVKAANCPAFVTKAKSSFTANVDQFAQTKTRSILTTLGYPLPTK